MKLSVAIFFVVLIAGAVAVHPVQKTRDIIDDANELYDCIMQSIAILQDSINGVISTVSGITGIIDDIKDLFAACQAIGGDNPSIIDQIQQVTCILGLRDPIRDTVASAVSELQNSVAQVVISGSNIAACFE